MKALLVILILFSASQSLADCTSPAGKVGQFQYISNWFWVCDGTNWTKLSQETGSGSCTAGEAGTMRFYSSTMEGCADPTGTYNWYAMSGETIGTCPGVTNGTFNYDPTLKNPRYCKGGEWYNMRAPRQFRISTSTTSSNIGGLATADAICQSDANSAGIGGTWIAWLSTSTVHAKDRLNENGSWYNSSKLASDNATLIDGSIDSGIILDMAGNNLGAGITWWTGTSEYGVLGEGHCSNWTSTAGMTNVGISNSTFSFWTNNTNTEYLCGATARRLLCFQL